jgi:hypothetical protein
MFLSHLIFLLGTGTRKLYGVLVLRRCLPVHRAYVFKNTLHQNSPLLNLTYNIMT